jgi:serine O-acetyltransferase
MVRGGDNCTLLPLVLFGKKRPGEKGTIIMGDNCYVGTGATILGPVRIGSNVTIAAGAVVIDDIPDNCIVGGVPAKIIKYK